MIVTAKLLARREGDMLDVWERRKDGQAVLLLELS